MKIKAIVFDFDDTLVQTKNIRYKAIKYAAKHFYKLDVVDSDIDKHWGKPFNEMISQVFKNIEATENIVRNYTSILHLYPNKPFSDTMTTLDTLRSSYLLGLVSSSIRKLINTGLKNVGIPGDVFSYIQTSDEVSYHKPDPRVFGPIKKYLVSKKISDNMILYIGDTVDDFLAATNAGFNFLGIEGRTTDKSIFKKKNADYISSLTDIIAYLQ